MTKQRSKTSSESSGVNNPHDELFRKQFQEPKNVIPILKGILSAEAMACLKTDTLKPSGIQLATTGLLRSIPDLLFTCECTDGAEAYVHLVFEHKSYKEEMVAVQVLIYMALIWNQYRLKKKALPHVIPIVFYHGAEAWTPKRLDELLPQQSPLLQFVPRFDVPFYDLARQPEERLRENVRESALLLLLKALLHEEQDVVERIATAIYIIRQSYDDNTKLTELLETFLNYLYYIRKDISVDDIDEKIEAISGEEGFMKTFQERLEEFAYNKTLKRGIALGKAEGEAEGEVKGKAEMLMKLIVRRFNDIAHDLKNIIFSISDPALLDRLSGTLMTCNNADEFLDTVHKETGKRL